ARLIVHVEPELLGRIVKAHDRVDWHKQPGLLTTKHDRNAEAEVGDNEIVVAVFQHDRGLQRVTIYHGVCEATDARILRDEGHVDRVDLLEIRLRRKRSQAHEHGAAQRSYQDALVFT